MNLKFLKSRLFVDLMMMTVVNFYYLNFLIVEVVVAVAVDDESRS
jgi:hypothetical protein